jgi:cytochrome c-type biogenesis protein CcmE
MKKLQKLILPVLLILIVFIIYRFYFSSGVDLGSFDDFDPNNNAVKEIRVQVLPDQSINPQSGNFSFMVADKNGKTLQAFGSASLPQGIGEAQTIILKGHVNQSGFCTHEVLLD